MAIPTASPRYAPGDMDSDLRTPGVTTQDVVNHMRNLPNPGSTAH